MWGHFRCWPICTRIQQTNHREPGLNAAHLANLGTCLYRMGDYRVAIEEHSQALAILHDTGNRRAKASR